VTEDYTLEEADAKYEDSIRQFLYAKREEKDERQATTEDSDQEECSDERHYICASDHKTYKNRCRFDIAKSKAEKRGEGLEIVAIGRCRTKARNNTRIQGTELVTQYTVTDTSPSTGGELGDLWAVHKFVIVKNFTFIEEPASWNSAMASCRSYGGKLAEPKSEEELRFLSKKMNVNKKYWLAAKCSGCRRVTDDGLNGAGRWQWLSGTGISANDENWLVVDGKQAPYEAPNIPAQHSDISFFIALEIFGVRYGFNNYQPNQENINYICELP